jgi:hypothetical protein
VEGAQGATAAARSHLCEALELARAKGPRFLVAAGLEAIGVQAIRDTQTQDAVRMLGAADALRQAMGVPVRPTDRPDLEGALKMARAHHWRQRVCHCLYYGANRAARAGNRGRTRFWFFALTLAEGEGKH